MVSWSLGEIKRLRLSWEVDECKPLDGGHANEQEKEEARVQEQEAGAYTRPLFGST